MKTALITGACGFVASHLSLVLSNKYTVVGSYYKVEPKFFKAKETFHLDVSQYKEVVNALKYYEPDLIFNLAGISFVPDAEKNIYNVLSANVQGVWNICSAIDNLNLNKKTKLAIISSGEVYDPNAEMPLNETSPIAPYNNYALSKLMAEEIACKYKRTSNQNIVIFRSFNHIGSGQSDKFVVSSFARQLALIKLGHLEPVLKVGNLEGKRDFTDVRDVVLAYMLGMEKGEGCYNIGSGKAISIKDIVSILIDICGIPVEINVEKSRYRPLRAKEVYTSYSKAKEDFFWQPKIKLEDSLQDVFYYWLNIEQEDYTKNS